MKILVVTKNWVGDILFEFPTIEAIKKHYPDATIACLAPLRCRDILQNHPDIDEVKVFDERNEHRSLWAKLKFIWQLRKEKWDQAYHLHRSSTRAFVLALGGVKERIGFGGSRRLFLTKKIEEPSPDRHQVDHFLMMLDGVGIPRAEKPPYQFYYQDEHRVNVEGLLRQNQIEKYCCFHLGANWLPKRWPSEHFAKLADLIHEKWNLPVVVTGASRDMPLFKSVKKHVQKAKLICFVGKTGLGELGALFHKSRFLVSGDSGPLHVASGVGAPVVALFGPTDPLQTGPRGIGEIEMIRYVPPGYTAPWYGEDLPKEGWLSQIQPEQVFQSIERRGWAVSTKEKPKSKKSLANIFSAKKKKDNEKKKILLFTLSNIGDVILTTPVLTALSDQFPNADVTVVCGPRARGVLEQSQFISRLVIYDKKVSWLEKLKMVKELRKDRFDYVIDLRNSMLPYFLRAKKRSPSVRKFKSTNMRKRHLEILKMMNLSTQERSPFDFFSLNEETSVQDKIRSHGVISQADWIVIAPAAASELKTWRLKGFENVIRRMLESRSEDILLVGDTREREIIDSLTEIDPRRIHNLAGETTMRELAAIVSKSSLLLANDSAVMHIGFELKKPVVAIFGPTSPEKYGQKGENIRIVNEDVECFPCQEPRCRFDRQACFEDLSDDKVWQACEELLREQAPTH